MPYRVKPDGSIECDNLEDALNLSHVILQKSAKPKIRTGTSGARGSRLDLTSDANKRKFIECLLKATAALTSAAIAVQMGLSPKSLPPVVRGLRNWAKKKHHDFGLLIEQRSKHVSGKVVGTYRLTDKGRQIFQEEMNKAAQNAAAA